MLPIPPDLLTYPPWESVRLFDPPQPPISVSLSTGGFQQALGFNPRRYAIFFGTTNSATGIPIVWALSDTMPAVGGMPVSTSTPLTALSYPQFGPMICYPLWLQPNGSSISVTVQEVTVRAWTDDLKPIQELVRNVQQERAPVPNAPPVNGRVSAKGYWDLLLSKFRKAS